ncbi:efflux transporter periplasmic adaptor subunit [Pantoea rodasii]|uniref:Efflux transporter periplasmic adaptor subunit n=1 Tax=Pantoea rodasii TaxID=1076549 RepID=A0A2M9WI60_9GAMM|nr:efflux RND transporter periplasmic adaptor subunit [Pantoea rodasii]PJZ07148.1 efflux transporter periplasmic adaptor subunit [Pantoea rodasii]
MQLRLTGFKFSAILFIVALFVAGCNKKTENKSYRVSVGVKTLQSRNILLSNSMSGRIVGYMTAEVRPQVEGIILKRLFEEGDNVKAGQVLYQIDDSSYQASYDQSLAQLRSAIALKKSNELKLNRLKTLVSKKFISKQDVDDAEAAFLQNNAMVELCRASLEKAQISLSKTKIKAPIDGIIGISSVTQGALVTTDQTTPLVTIRALDPIYADFSQSAVQLLKLKRQQCELHLHDDPEPVTVQIKLEDGSSYAYSGQLELRGVSVNENTDTVKLRAIFPNPQHLLLPGMFVEATLPYGLKKNAILAPEPGINRDVNGHATAWIVNKRNKVERRDVTTDQIIGNEWLISSGLTQGDRLIVEGTEKVKAGMIVKAVEVSSGNIATKPGDN